MYSECLYTLRTITAPEGRGGWEQEKECMRMSEKNEICESPALGGSEGHAARGSVTFVNLTPHEVVLFRGDEVVMRIPPSGKIARVGVKQEQIGEVAGVPVVKNVYGDVEGLPAPRPNTFYIVSSIVLSRVEGRDDVVAPDTGPTAVRDEAGRIIGVRRFVKGGEGYKFVKEGGAVLKRGEERIAVVDGRCGVTVVDGVVVSLEDGGVVARLVGGMKKIGMDG